jgi:hypothetical protein
MIAEIKTPFMRVYSPHPNETQIGDGAREIVESMLHEAQLYIGGARAQTNLFDQDEGTGNGNGEDAA